MTDFKQRLAWLEEGHATLLSRKNESIEGNGVYERYKYPILTAEHAPLFWRYDLDERTNPYLMERFGIHATLNSGAIKWNGKYVLVVRVEGADRKSFFAVAESPNGVDNFRFWDRPVTMPEWGEPATNVYDMRLTAHEDGWIYGIFCVERKDPAAAPGDLSSAVAAAGIARTKDLVTWERLPDLQSKSQQRNVVLHPEFVDGKYALYTRPQDGFIDAGNGGGIGWALVDSMEHAVVTEEKIIGLASPGARRARLCERPPLCAVHVYDGVGRPYAHDCGAGGVLHGPGRGGICGRRDERSVLERLDLRRGREGVHLLRLFRHADACGDVDSGPAGRLLQEYGS